MNLEDAITPEQREQWANGQDITIKGKVEKWRPKMTWHLDPVEAKDMERGIKIRAYVNEHKGDWAADWSDDAQPKHCVYYNHILNLWTRSVVDVYQSIGVVYMPKQVAIELVKKLNAGLIEGIPAQLGEE